MNYAIGGDGERFWVESKPCNGPLAQEQARAMRKVLDAVKRWSCNPNAYNLDAVMYQTRRLKVIEAQIGAGLRDAKVPE
jgi:hypothetical protein